MSELNKVVVFDLDETLGYFQEFGILWNSLQIKYSNQLNVKFSSINLFAFSTLSLLTYNW